VHVERHQRTFLLEDFEGFVADISTDFDKDGQLGPETIRLVDYGSRLIAWLRGGPEPGEEVRAYLEHRLRVLDEELEYEKLAYEHDALAAAIEALR
jgi:hypothetical protein